MATIFTELDVRGHTHDDTVSFNDLEILQGCTQVRLIRIRVWYDDYVYGIQTIYETGNRGMVVSPKRMNESHESWKLKYEEIAFNRDEWIEGFGGHHGNIIDHVKFVTNLGRSLRFGTSDGGDPFEIEIPYGKCIGALKGGYGGHLHNIGCAVIPQLPTIQYQYGLPADLRIEGTKSYGPTHDDTQIHSDVATLEASAGQHRISSLKVYYSDECVYGLCVEYEENGRMIVTKSIGGSWNREEHKQKRIYFTHDEFIKNIYGYIGSFWDLLVIETTNGDVERFGNDRDPNFNLEIEGDKVVTGISFGTGGHLHNITAHYSKRPLIRRFNAPSSSLVEYSIVSKSSGVYGATNDDTVPFNDFNKINQSNTSLRLIELTVYYYPDESVYGLRHKWSVNGQQVIGGKHRGSEYDSAWSAEKKCIHFDNNQYITRVYGRCNGHFRQLGLELNTGEVFEFGGSDGDPFEVELPEGSAVGCITGGKNGHLHNIQVWYGPKNDFNNLPAACFYLPIENRFPFSSNVGGTHGDTTHFADNVNINQQNFRIDTIKVYYNEWCVGIMSIYEVDGQYIYGEKKNMASWVNPDDRLDVSMLNMEIDEFVTKVSGYQNGTIAQLHLETNKGRTLDAGSQDGDHFEIDKVFSIINNKYIFTNFILYYIYFKSMIYNIVKSLFLIKLYYLISDFFSFSS